MLYQGDEIFAFTKEGKQPIIDNILYEKDFACIVAKPKVGKSILAQQLGFCITNGADFLGNKTRVTGDVVYFQAEGDQGEMFNRIRSMDKAIHCNRANLFHFYEPGTKLNTPSGLNYFIKMLDNYTINPELIIIDPMYMAFTGDLSKQTTVCEICDAVDTLKSKYDCAVLLIHHASKDLFNKSGGVIDRGDNSAFGSAFLVANVDTLFMMRKEMEVRHLRCDTQRSGLIREHIAMTLIDPAKDPARRLFFSLDGAEVDNTPIEVEKELKLSPISVQDLASKLGKHSNTIRNSIKSLIRRGKVKRIQEGKHVRYTWV